MSDPRHDPRFDRIVERAVESLRARVRDAADPALVARSIFDIRRRDFLSAGALAISSALLAACDAQGPEGSKRVLRYAERKNEGIERWLTRHTSMDAPRDRWRAAGQQFPRYYVAKTMPVWDAATRGPWSLEVGGLVDRPLRLTLDDLMRMRQQRQRVDHFCVEGWTAVATFWGVPMTAIAKAASAKSEAQYVDFASFDDDYHESWDLESATHPQTMIVYAKDGQFLSPGYGAPARLHSPVKLGYKNVKYLTKITFMRERNGGYWSDQGYEWYAGT
ncbi:MAG: molybdopterin-dependent oxidoreductase [Gemmatimonadaceae bacterium]